MNTMIINKKRKTFTLSYDRLMELRLIKDEYFTYLKEYEMLAMIIDKGIEQIKKEEDDHRLALLIGKKILAKDQNGEE